MNDRLKPYCVCVLFCFLDEETHAGPEQQDLPSRPGPQRAVRPGDMFLSPSPPSPLPPVSLSPRLPLLSFSPPPSLYPCSRLLPGGGGALRAVGGACEREALRAPGAGRGVSQRPGHGALWLVLHGGRGGGASGAAVRHAVHAAGPRATGPQQVMVVDPPDH